MARTCTGIVGSNPTGGKAGLRTLIKALINCIINNCIVVSINDTYIHLYRVLGNTN